MGSGSSRSGRALRRLRSRDSLPAGPGGTAPDGGTGPLAAAAAAREVEAEAEAEEGADGRHRDPAAPPDGEDDTLRLLDELLAESAAWGAEEPTPRGPARPRPAAGAGSSVSSKQSAEDHAESSGVSGAPGSSHKSPERQSAISYDYSEEELMASIEQEYCR
ncbi:cystin-1 isoform X1 [Manis pentadactyla]|uniref:cystin-1 isoform X1 n=1 Tax=Manis pentadactyla TaxID=143292 RepID=UPI00255C58F7|nr:cystin-1 isoform X1 [Manis pentadactyla]